MSPLSPERWRALSLDLDEALDIAADDRDAWLAALCERDAALGADLKRLLAEHEDLQNARFLERSPPTVRQCRRDAVAEGPNPTRLSPGLADRRGRDGQRMACGTV